MNATHLRHVTGRLLRPGVTLTATFMLLLALRPAKAAEVVVTITGNLVDGYDQFHIFGVGTPRKNSDVIELAGLPFTLVFTFDDAKGRATSPGSCAQTGSGIEGRSPSSPGTATLTLGEKSYTFGTRKDSHSSAWRSIAALCSNSEITFEVNEGAGWSNGTNIVNVTMVPAKNSRSNSLTQNPDWRASLSTTAMDNTGGFFISRGGDYRHEARGNFDVKKLTISGAQPSWMRGILPGGR